MVKPPKIRHSKSRREPLTIEIGPDEVSRVAEVAGDARSEVETDVTSAERFPQDGPPQSVAEPAADDASAGQDGMAAQPGAGGAAAERPGRAADDENINFMGSEWPPEPAAAGQEMPKEEERVRHAFGREPEPPLPGTGADRGQATIEARPAQRNTMPVLAAGLVGGVVALLGAGVLQWTGMLSSGSGPAEYDGAAVAALKAEVEGLKQQVEAVKSAPGGDTSALSQSVTDLSSALDQAKAEIAALKDAVAQGAAGDGAAVETLNRKVGEIETAVAALKETLAQGAGGGAALETLNQKLDALQSSVVALEGSTASREVIDTVNQKLAALEGAVTAASDAAKAGEARIATLEQSVSSLSGQVASQAAQPKVALAIAAAALKSAIERGGTFTAEVETFAAIAPNAPELPALREIAAKGVASRSELAEGMEEAANAMIAADQPLPADAGFWDSLWASAESLVKVRPIGAVEGDTVPAKVARMEVAVKSGDFPKALAEFDTLPEAVKAAGQAFADRIKARVAAEGLVAKALAGALKSA